MGDLGLFKSPVEAIGPLTKLIGRFDFNFNAISLFVCTIQVFS
jgi:hypothetical protein